jgi:hypothetical protein
MKSILFAIVASASLHAQWIHEPTRGIPRTADGKASMTAPAPKTADGKPDLSGLWTLAGGGDGIKKQLKPSEIQPWAEKLSKEREENLGSDSPGTECLPGGFIGFGLVKIVQTPGLVLVLTEDLTYRQIFTDGRELPKDPNPAWMGYSVGHWEDDTLVVESTGYNDRTWIDGGYPHTEQMHMTERYRRTDFGHLTAEVSISDPAIYAKPIRSKLDGLYAADTDLIEYVCAENEKDRAHLVGHKSDTKRSVQLPAELLSKYVGTYMVRTKDVGFPGPEFIPVNIMLEKGELEVVVAGLAKQRLTALSETRFTDEAIGVFEFRSNDQGEVTHIAVEAPGGEFTATRRQSSTPRITLFDRTGNTVTQLGEPRVDAQPALSPDGTRVAVVKRAPGGDGQIWVHDVRTGQSTRITENGPARSSPVWSPDGTEIAYVTNFAVYRKASDGSGAETLVYNQPTGGAGVFLTSWSPDGRLCLWSGDSLVIVPLRGALKPVSLDKARGGSLSPDGRYLAYSSNESGQWAVYIKDLRGDAEPTRVSQQPAAGGIFWRKDGMELFYLSIGAGQAVMAAQVEFSPAVAIKSTTRLFPVSGIPGPNQLSNVAASDGQRFVFQVLPSAGSNER